MIILPGEISVPAMAQYLASCIAPRPIALVSSINEAGEANLSPFSYFNVFGANPATLVFSTVRRVRNNTNKHTLENVYETMEVVINLVNYSMVQQASLASCEFPEGVDEFVKAGFTKLASTKVRPWRVKESPVQMECRVSQVIETGHEGGAGNLVVCEILAMHIEDAVLDEKQNVNPWKMDLVARMGSSYYCRANGDAIFTVPKPNTEIGIGFDQLPDGIRNSSLLTGNDLAKLANVSALPEIDPAFTDDNLKQIVQYYAINPQDMDLELHSYAKKLLEEDKVEEAWQVLLSTS